MVKQSVQARRNTGKKRKEYNSNQLNDTNQTVSFEHINPLLDLEYQPVPGIFYTRRSIFCTERSGYHHGSALWRIQRRCSSGCSYCSIPDGIFSVLTYDEIEAGIRFLEATPDVREVILEGGDPLLSAQEYIRYIFGALASLQKHQHIDLIRIATRAPITRAGSMSQQYISYLKMIDMPHLVLHINHADELTEEVRKMIYEIRLSTDTILLSQTTILRNYNDDAKILFDTLNQITHLGIRPFYIYNLDPVIWGEDVTVSHQTAEALWNNVQNNLCELAATARYATAPCTSTNLIQ